MMNLNYYFSSRPVKKVKFLVPLSTLKDINSCFPSVSTMNHLIDFGVCALADCKNFIILHNYF